MMQHFKETNKPRPAYRDIVAYIKRINSAPRNETQDTMTRGVRLQMEVETASCNSHETQRRVKVLKGTVATNATFAQQSIGLHHYEQHAHFKPSTADLVRGLEIVPVPGENRAEPLPVATA